jgi:hypothetical protein
MRVLPFSAAELFPQGTTASAHCLFLVWRSLLECQLMVDSFLLLSTLLLTPSAVITGLCTASNSCLHSVQHTHNGKAFILLRYSPFCPQIFKSNVNCLSWHTHSLSRVHRYSQMNHWKATWAKCRRGESAIKQQKWNHKADTIEASLSHSSTGRVTSSSRAASSS